jgi:hypothetical protein
LATTSFPSKSRRGARATPRCSRRAEPPLVIVTGTIEAFKPASCSISDYRHPNTRRVRHHLAPRELRQRRHLAHVPDHLAVWRPQRQPPIVRQFRTFAEEAAFVKNRVRELVY